ncbi:MAG: hypothetical protein JSV38_09735, partial [Desulfobacterales bacterium]
TEGKSRPFKKPTERSRKTASLGFYGQTIGDSVLYNPIRRTLESYSTHGYLFYFRIYVVINI